VIGLSASSPTEVEDVFASIVQQRLGALLVSPDPFFIASRSAGVFGAAPCSSLGIPSARIPRRRVWRGDAKHL